MVSSALGRLTPAVITCLALAATARAESVYVVSQSSGKLMRFDAADTGATTVVTTLVENLVQPSALAFGPDGRLYIAEWGDDDTIDPRISRYDVGTGQWSVVATLDPFAQFNPSAIAFRPAGLGGEMLVGRVGTPDAVGEGNIVSISGWNTGAPVVSLADYNTGISLNGSSGLAIAADEHLAAEPGRTKCDRRRIELGERIERGHDAPLAGADVVPGDPRVDLVFVAPFGDVEPSVRAEGQGRGLHQVLHERRHERRRAGVGRVEPHQLAAGLADDVHGFGAGRHREGQAGDDCRREPAEGGGNHWGKELQGTATGFPRPQPARTCQKVNATYEPRQPPVRRKGAETLRSDAG